jgi:hypothetical protein
MNPSNYWVMNGHRLFPHDRAFEINKPFEVKAPADGRMEFEASDPSFAKLALVQALFLFGAVALFVRLRRSQTRSALT